MPTMTPGASALSVAVASNQKGTTTNTQSGAIFQNSTSGPYTAQNAVNQGANISGYTPQATTPTPPVSKYTPGSLAYFQEIARGQGNGLKEAQKMYQDSLLAGTSQINGNNQFYRDDKGGLHAGVAPGATSVVEKLNQYFNASQIANFEGRNLPNTANTDPYASVFGDLFDGVQKPDTYSSLDEYTKLRDQYGVSDIESQINELSAQEEAQIALTRKRLQTAEDTPVALGVISGRQGEIEKQDSERLAMIQRTKQGLVNQLNTKNATIKMFMDFHKEDYTMANDRFEKQFSQATKMQEIIRQQKMDAYDQYTDDRDYTQKLKDQEQDNYRAMYNTVFNGISTGAVDPSQFTPEIKAQMASLEMKAGLPIGFTEMIRNKNPKADILYTGTTTDNNGNETLNIVMRGADGKITTQNVGVGNSGTKGRYQYKDDGSVFDTATGKTIKGIPSADIISAIDKAREEGQCGEGVNDYLQNLGEKRLFGDLYSEKKAHINSTAPVPGAIAIWNPGGATKENGHLGIVLEDNEDSVLIQDWNWNGDEKKDTHLVKKSDIQKTGGYYVPGSKVQSSKENTSSEKLNTDLRGDASELVGKMESDGISFDNAHAQLYAKYAGPLKNLGYSDEDVKLALHKLLGGK